MSQPVILHAHIDDAGVLRIFSRDGQPCDMIAIHWGDVSKAMCVATEMAQHWRKTLGQPPLPTGRQLRRVDHRGVN